MTLQQRVKQFILDNFYLSDGASLGDDTSLIAEGLVDSTGMLEVIGFLESEYGIAVRDDETTPENLETIGRITRFVERKTRDAAAS